MLNVGNNKLHNLPSEIGELANLAVFNARHNRLSEKSIPDSFINLTNLRSLDLSYNYFTQLPMTANDEHIFMKMQKLQLLTLNHNRICGSIHPASLLCLTNLVVLQIRYNQITKFIPVVQNHRGLLNGIQESDKERQRNKSFSVENYFGPLKFLRTLDVRDNPELLEVPGTSFFSQWDMAESC